MKKTIVVMLAMLAMFSIVSEASAANRAYFTITVPCEESGGSLPYYYDDTDSAEKMRDTKTIYIAHRVEEISASETDRMAAFDLDTQRASGDIWHPADSCLYPCTSNAIMKGHHYNAAVRINSNYATKYGLDTVTITGYVWAD